MIMTRPAPKIQGIQQVGPKAYESNNVLQLITLRREQGYEIDQISTGVYDLVLNGEDAGYIWSYPNYAYTDLD